MERKILRRLRQLDFVNMDGFRAVPRQDFLGFGFFLRRSDSDPDQWWLELDCCYLRAACICVVDCNQFSGTAIFAPVRLCHL
jgi:hypothetical protein